MKATKSNPYRYHYYMHFLPSSHPHSLLLPLHSMFPSATDYFVIRLDHKDGLQSPEDRPTSPLVKQVQWFEDRLSTVMDVTFDPRGEWLACVTLSGAVHLIPVAPTMIVSGFIACDSKWIHSL